MTLTASASSGFVFFVWGGDCSGCGSSSTCGVTLNDDMSCTADFALSFGDGDDTIVGCDEPASPPSTRTVGLCTGSCLDTAPVKVTVSTANVCFNYSSRFNALVGFMDKNLTHIYWLNRSGSICSVSTSFDMALDNERSFSCDAELPSGVLDEGVVFWFVTPDSMADVDWIRGPYELKFYSLTCTTETIGGGLYGLQYRLC